MIVMNISECQPPALFVDNVGDNFNDIFDTSPELAWRK